MIEIEIKGHYGQLIKGYLRKVVDDKGVISYADDPESEESIPLSELRLPPSADSNSLEDDLNLVEKYQYHKRSLNPHLQVEALLPVPQPDNPQENTFTEALSSVQIAKPSIETSTASRLANPLACLSCPSWWPCVVAKVRDAHAVVQLRPVMPPATDDSSPPKEFTDLAKNLSTLTEICERSTLRPATSVDAPTLASPDSLFTHRIAIPQDLFPHAADLKLHESIVRHCGEPVSLFIDNEQLVLLSPSSEVIRKASLLEEMHLRMLRQKCGVLRIILRKAHESMGSNGEKGGADGANSSRGPGNDDAGLFVENFTVSGSFMGLAIGTQGTNIKAARSVPGVVRIDVREYRQYSSQPDAERTRKDSNGSDGASAKPHMAHFKVVAETEQAARTARNMLEFCELCVLVPKRLIGRIVGTRTSNISSITEKSGTRHIHLESNRSNLPQPPDGKVPSTDYVPECVKIEDKHPELASPMDKDTFSGFYIMGTREAVEKARLLITFQVECIYDLEQLEVEKVGLMRELPNGMPYHLQQQMHENGAGPQQRPPGGGRGNRGGPPGPRGPAAGDPNNEDAPRNLPPGNQRGGRRNNNAGGRQGGPRAVANAAGDDAADTQRGGGSSPTEEKPAAQDNSDNGAVPGAGNNATYGRRRPTGGNRQRRGNTAQRGNGSNKPNGGSSPSAEQNSEACNGITTAVDGANTNESKKGKGGVAKPQHNGSDSRAPEVPVGASQ